MDYFIGLDLGTTGIKALVFDGEGTLRGEHSVEVELTFPEADYVEQDPGLWYETAAAVIRQAVGKAQADPAEVRAISISSQGISIVPVDSEFKPLSQAISWLDMRAKKELAFILSKIEADELYQLTGKTASEAYSLPKLLWIKNNLPDVFKRTHCFLMPMDYTIARMTGVLMTDHTLASGTMAYDLSNQGWSKKILDAVGIPVEVLPPIAWSGKIAGQLTEQAARLCGLTCETVVINGGQDQKVAAFGAGLDYHVSTISIGTAGALEFLYEKPPFHPQKIPAFSYLGKGKWVLEGCIGTAGAAIKWMKNTLFPELSYDEIDALAGQSPVGSNGVIFWPFLSGLAAANVFGKFDGLKLSTGRPDLARALFESLAFESRIIIEAAELQGATISRTNIFGGGSRSGLLCQTIADVTGRTIYSFNCPEMGAYGAARLASIGWGKELDQSDHSQFQFIEWKPQAENKKRYEQFFNSYFACRSALL